MEPNEVDLFEGPISDLERATSSVYRFMHYNGQLILLKGSSQNEEYFGTIEAAINSAKNNLKIGAAKKEARTVLLTNQIAVSQKDGYQAYVSGYAAELKPKR